MNMYGMPLMGADVCGYSGDTSAELCARWTVLSALYPFSRNHNDMTSADQYPYSPMFQKDYMTTPTKVTYTDVMREGMRKKYSLLRYHYSSVMGATENGGQVVRPMFYDFPEDPMAWTGANNNFMYGDSVKVSYLTDKLDADTTDFYFPAGTWCSIFDTKNACFISPGGAAGMMTLPSKI